MKKFYSFLVLAAVIVATAFHGEIVEAGRRGIVSFERYRGRTWVRADGTVVERTRARGFSRGARASDCAGLDYGSCAGRDHAGCN